MKDYILTPSQIREFKKDHRNDQTPYKAIASGVAAPLRFKTESEAMTFFRRHNGRCIVSRNTNDAVTYIAYKFN